MQISCRNRPGFKITFSAVSLIFKTERHPSFSSSHFFKNDIPCFLQGVFCITKNTFFERIRKVSATFEGCRQNRG